MKILHLTLKKDAFEVMSKFEKRLEFRSPSEWIKSRLFDKDGKHRKYDRIKFVNGYGNDKPYFICEYRGFFVAPKTSSVSYSNGLEVKVNRGDYVIAIGQITEKNLQL